MYDSTPIGRFRWALTQPRPALTFAGRMRLRWHDFILHALLDRGTERCSDCGRAYPIWRADDDLYVRLIGSDQGLYCERCFQVRAHGASL